MVQRHEIEAWVNPEAWDDMEKAAQVVEEIAACATDDEEVWIAIAQRIDGESVESLARDRRVKAGLLEDATRALRGRVKLELAESGGEGKSDLHRRSGVSRATIDGWLRSATQ